MRVTIVVDDNVVLVDGKARTVDTSPLIDGGIHAVQWYDTFGEEEYRSEIDMERKAMTRKPNAVINDFSAYEPYVEAWQIENAKQSLIEAEQKRRMEEFETQARANQAFIEEMMKLPPDEQEAFWKARQDDLRNRG